MHDDDDDDDDDDDRLCMMIANDGVNLHVSEVDVVLIVVSVYFVTFVLFSDTSLQLLKQT